MLDPDLIPTPLRSQPGNASGRPSSGTMATGWGRTGAFLLFVAHLLNLRLRGRINNRTRAAAVRRLFESLGCTWIKLGQLMAMRRDIFSQEFCEEMSGVQDRAAQFRVDVAREILERNLKCQVEQVFAGFGAPVAAASVGQVHSASLKIGGVRVAIKIRRPGIVAQVTRDLRVMGWAVRFIRRFKIKETFAWEGLLWELRLALLDELDYRLESTSLKTMRKTLAAHGIYVPRVFTEFSTEEVLVMEFVQGVPMSDFVAVSHEDPERIKQWLAENEIDPDQVGRELYLSLHRQIFEDNLFHGDLHPGNIVLLRKSRIALIDFGAVGSLDAQFNDKFRLYIKAISNRDYHTAVDVWLLLAPQDVDTTRARLFRARYLAMVRNFEFQTSAETMPYHDRSVVHFFSRVMRELAQLGIPLEWTFMRVDRAQLTLDASLMFLIPDVNYFELTRTYFEQAATRGVEKLGTPPVQRRLLVDAARLAELMANQAEEEIRTAVELLRHQAKSFKPLLGKVEAIWNGIGTAVWVGLSIICLAALLLLLGSPLNWPVIRIAPWAQDTSAAGRTGVLAAGLYLQVKVRRLFR